MPVEKRRNRRIYLTTERLTILLQRLAKHAIAAGEAPADLLVTGYAFDRNLNVLAVYCESEEFEPIPVGEIVPRWEPEFLLLDPPPPAEPLPDLGRQKETFRRLREFIDYAEDLMSIGAAQITNPDYEYSDSDFLRKVGEAKDVVLSRPGGSRPAPAAVTVETGATAAEVDAENWTDASPFTLHQWVQHRACGWRGQVTMLAGDRIFVLRERDGSSCSFGWEEAKVELIPFTRAWKAEPA